MFWIIAKAGRYTTPEDLFVFLQTGGVSDNSQNSSVTEELFSTDDDDVISMATLGVEGVVRMVECKV